MAGSGGLRSPDTRHGDGSTVIISHAHQFIFVKTAKTAGTSIEVLLAAAIEPEAVVTPFFSPEPDHEPRNFRGGFDPLPELAVHLRHGSGVVGCKQTLRRWRRKQRYFHHMPAWQIRLRDRQAWASYRTFCVERDPWEKVVSGWRWLCSSRGLTLDLDAYLDRLERHIRQKRFGIGTFPYNLPNYTDPRTGEVIVDEVLQHATLQDDLGRLLPELGLDADPTALPSAKRFGQTSTAQELTDAQVERVARLFAPEIALFGYQPPAR